MGALTVYAIKSAICLTLLYLPYTLLLRKETLFAVNRWGLLIITLISLILPSMDISLWDNRAFDVFRQHGEAIIEVGMPIPTLEADTAATTATTPNQDVFSWTMLLVAIYLIGVITTLAVKAIDFINMLRGMSKGSLWKETHDGITIHCKPAGSTPFSWMKNIIISEDDYDNNKEILIHENAHIRYGHSWDTLFITIAEIFQWFNPCIWMLGNSLYEVHEYEADDAVLSHGVTAQKYQMLLIKKAVGASSYAFANSFNHSLLKNRITMMKKNHSSKWSCAKYLYILPMSAIALGAFASTDIEKATAEVSNLTVGKVKEFVSTRQVPGGKNPFRTGEMPTESAELQDREAQADIESNALEDKNDGPVLIFKDKGDVEPLIVVNGKIIAENITLEEVTNIEVVLLSKYGIKQDDIASITVLKDEAAIAIWGEKGKNGVIEIKTKDNKEPEVKVQKEATDEDEVFTAVEQMPEFPGGVPAIMQYLATNIKYPKDARECEISGRVLASFVVQEDGSIGDIKIIKSVANPITELNIITDEIIVNAFRNQTEAGDVSKEAYIQKYNKGIQQCDEEVKRIISTMPKWKPGKQRGEEVRVKYTIPVNFRLN